jgi:DNA-binding protein HU-beta
MNKTEMVRALAQHPEVGSQRQASKLIDLMAETIMQGVADDGIVVITGFGTFERRHRAERMGRNPRTGEDVTIPARDVPGFRAAKHFKDLVA